MTTLMIERRHPSRFARVAGVVLLATIAAGCASTSTSTSTGASTSNEPGSGASAPLPDSTIAPASGPDSSTNVTDGAAIPTPTTIPSAPAPTTIPTTTTPTTTARPTSTSPPDPSAISFTEVGSVARALNLAVRPNDDALYIVSQSGFIVAMRDGVVNDTRLLDIGDDISSGGEQGLLGLAFSLDGNRAFINSTNRSGDTEITEYVVGTDGVFDPASRRLLLTIGQPHSNHNGGQVRIGRDGFLYIGMGDGGSGNDPDRRSLNVGDLLGKMLRIDPTPNADSPYSIPPDNPFVGVDGARPEIWSVGLRNPWRFSFDMTTDDLWIADVGQGQWEEISVAWADQGGARGANFGWSAFEGTHRFNRDQPDGGVTSPIWEYEHGERGCSISGGIRYRGDSIPTLYGYYVYADYCNGEVRALEIRDDRTAGTEVILTDGLEGLSEVAQGPTGELFVLSVQTGSIYTVTANS